MLEKLSKRDWHRGVFVFKRCGARTLNSLHEESTQPARKDSQEDEPKLWNQ